MTMVGRGSSGTGAESVALARLELVFTDPIGDTLCSKFSREVC